MNTVLWEAVALRLAAEAGIQVPIWSLHSLRKKAVLLLDRFDRSVGMRIPFLSAMSMLTANDNEAHSYMEIADTLRRHGAAPAEDLPQLWRRIVFNVLITNTDDHLRNHAFLYAGSEGWRLSPAYDLNPVVGPRVLSLAVDADDRIFRTDGKKCPQSCGGNRSCRGEMEKGSQASGHRQRGDGRDGARVRAPRIAAGAGAKLMVAHGRNVPDPETRPGAIGHGQAPHHPYNHCKL